MIFLSQLLDAPVIDSHQDELGLVEDVIVNAPPHRYPVITGIVVRRRRRHVFIESNHIESLSPALVTLSRKESWPTLPDKHGPTEIRLRADLLDQQIIDVGDIRVVRVNDLQLAKISGEFHLLAIDVSTAALLRRLHLRFPGMKKFFRPKLIDWHNMSFIPGKLGNLKLRTPHEKLTKLHPADIANVIEGLSIHHSSKVMASFDEETAAEILAEVEPKYKDTLLEHIDHTRLAEIMEEMPTDEAVDVIQDLSPLKRAQVLKKLKTHTAKHLHQLSHYKENRAGGLMTTDVVTIRAEMSVKDAIENIRELSPQHASIYHLFVLNKKEILTGVVSLRTMILANPKTKIKNIMSPVVVTATLDHTQKEIATLLTKYNLLSVAIVDDQKKLLGVVTVDDIMRTLLPAA